MKIGFLLAVGLASVATLHGCAAYGPPGNDKMNQLVWYRPGRDAYVLMRTATSTPEQRRWGIIRLGRHGAPNDIYAILPYLSSGTEPVPLVRATAATALRLLGDRRAIPDLLRATRDPSPLVRADVARTLGALGRPEEVPALVRLLKDDRSPSVRLEAVLALSDIAEIEDLSPLVDALDDLDDSVCFAAHRALLHISGQDLSPARRSWQDWLASQSDL